MTLIKPKKQGIVQPWKGKGASHQFRVYVGYIQFIDLPQSVQSGDQSYQTGKAKPGIVELTFNSQGSPLEYIDAGSKLRDHIANEQKTSYDQVYVICVSATKDECEKAIVAHMMASKTVQDIIKEQA